MPPPNSPRKPKSRPLAPNARFRVPVLPLRFRSVSVREASQLFYFNGPGGEADIGSKCGDGTSLP